MMLSALQRLVVPRQQGARRHSFSLLAVGLVAALTGPFDIHLESTSRVPAAVGRARLVYAASPFGVAVLRDGRARYDVQITAAGLPDPSTLGDFTTYVAWQVSTNLKDWTPLGRVENGTVTLGSLELNKFLLVITAESNAAATTRSGPTVLHGISPSSWLQSFLGHPLFRGMSQ